MEGGREVTPQIRPQGDCPGVSSCRTLHTDSNTGSPQQATFHLQSVF